MGGRLQAWEVVGVGGIVVARGVMSCDSAGTMVWNKRAYLIPEQRRTTNQNSSFVVRLPRPLCTSLACWSCRGVPKRTWCLSMDGEGRQQQATCVDDGGYVEGCGFRIWSEFPLAEIADILSRKEVTRLVLRA